MAKRLKEDGKVKVSKVRVLEGAVAMCAVLYTIGSHRIDDFEHLTKMGEMPAIIAGKSVRLLNPVRGISILPRESVEVIGSAKLAAI